MELGSMNKAEFRRWLEGEMEEVVKNAFKRHLSKLTPTEQATVKPKFFTYETLGKELNLSRGTLNNYVKDGKLIKYKIKGKVHFKTEDVEKLVEYSKK